MLKPRHPHRRWIGLFYGLCWGATFFFLYCVKFVVDQVRPDLPNSENIREIALFMVMIYILYLLWATGLVIRTYRQPRSIAAFTWERHRALMILSLLILVLLSIFLYTYLSLALFAYRY
jgi:hypothetical protein